MSTPVTHMQKTGNAPSSVLQRQPSRITEIDGTQRLMPAAVFDAIRSKPPLTPTSTTTQLTRLTRQIIAAADLEESESLNTKPYLGDTLPRTKRGATPHPFLADIRKANGSFLNKKESS